MTSLKILMKKIARWKLGINKKSKRMAKRLLHAESWRLVFIIFLSVKKKLFNLQQGYLLSFCFNKTKKSGLLPPVELKGRTLIEAIV